MIGNLLNILLGLWLAYSAIFANPVGEMNNTALAITAVAVVVLAAWARQTDGMSWPSATNIVLGAALVAVAAARWAIGVGPLVCFWIILLIGIVVAIAAMSSMLYRPEAASSAPSS